MAYKVSKPFDFKVGHVVLIYEAMGRAHYKIGVITRLHLGLDGHVRSVDLNTAYGKTSRTLDKLLPLEIPSHIMDDSGYNEVVTNKIKPMVTDLNVAVQPQPRPIRRAALEARKRFTDA